MKTYLVIEHFRPGKLEAIYERFRRQGRMLPPGLHFCQSWLAAAGDRCFQLMQTDDAARFAQWTQHWEDLVAFEIVELGPKPGEEPPPPTATVAEKTLG